MISLITRLGNKKNTHKQALICDRVCSGGAERGVLQARAAGVAAMGHRRPVRRRGHERHVHLRRQHEPRHQVRLLRPQQHHLPHHRAVSVCTARSRTERNWVFDAFFPLLRRCPLGVRAEQNPDRQH